MRLQKRILAVLVGVGMLFVLIILPTSINNDLHVGATRLVATADGLSTAGNIKISGAYALATIASHSVAATQAPTAAMSGMAGMGDMAATQAPTAAMSGMAGMSDMAATQAPTAVMSGMAGMGDMDITSAVYLTIENTGDKADKLLTTSTDIANAQLHQTVIQNDVASMQPVVGGLDIPAHSTVALNPGGYHIMLMALKQDLAPGDSFALTLTFASGTTLTFQVPVTLP